MPSMADEWILTELWCLMMEWDGSLEQWKGGVSTHSLMKLLIELIAVWLTQQKTLGKSLVIALPMQGGGDISANGLFGFI